MWFRVKRLTVEPYCLTMDVTCAIISLSCFCYFAHFVPLILKSSEIRETLSVWLSGKESACNTGDAGLITGLGRSLREGNGNPLQNSGLKNPMDRRAWWATVHGVTKSQT